MPIDIFLKKKTAILDVVLKLNTLAKICKYFIKYFLE